MAEAPGGFHLVLGKMGWSGLFDGKMEIREVRFFRSLAPITGVLWCFFWCICVFGNSGRVGSYTLILRLQPENVYEEEWESSLEKARRKKN